MFCLPLRLLPARGTSFSLLRQRKGSKRKATADTGLALPNFPHSARFFGRARNLRLRRFEHASPYSPKNRAPFGCVSREKHSSTFDTRKPISSFSRVLIGFQIELLDMEFLVLIKAT